jgi:hypothetical protein
VFRALPLLLALAAPDAGPSPADVPAPVRRLGHADPSVRQHAGGALWLLAHEVEAARPALVRALHDPDPDVRLRAALALSRLVPPDPAALPVLRAGAARPARVRDLFRYFRLFRTRDRAPGACSPRPAAPSSTPALHETGATRPH